jgi:hypothetical protein
MKKCKGLIILLPILIVALIVAWPLLITRFAVELNQSIDEHYSPDYYSATSIQEARQMKIFVNQLTLRSTEVRGLGIKYDIQEAWIEQAVKIKYEGAYPNRKRNLIPMGIYHLMVLFKQNIETEYGVSLVCNNSIRLNGWQSKQVRFAEVQDPLPSSVTCKIVGDRTLN